jgi:hypothetical protein
MARDRVARHERWSPFASVEAPIGYSFTLPWNAPIAPASIIDRDGIYPVTQQIFVRR